MRIPVLGKEAPSEGRVDTRKFACTGVFAALSIVMSPIAFMLPRVGWGQAIIDPVSLPWMFCFFLFGLKAGVTCAIIGALALFIFDPTAIPILGPLWKLIATTPLMIIPYIVQRSFRGERKEFATFRSYALASIPAIIVRAAIMPPLVLLYLSFLFGSWWEFHGGLVIVAATIAVLNTLQSAVDVGVPWAILYATRRFLYSLGGSSQETK